MLISCLCSCFSFAFGCVPVCLWDLVYNSSQKINSCQLSLVGDHITRWVHSCQAPRSRDQEVIPGSRPSLKTTSLIPELPIETAKQLRDLLRLLFWALHYKCELLLVFINHWCYWSPSPTQCNDILMFLSPKRLQTMTSSCIVLIVLVIVTFHAPMAI